MAITDYYQKQQLVNKIKNPTTYRFGEGVTRDAYGKYHADGKEFNTAEDLIKYQQSRSRFGEMNASLAKYRAETGQFRDRLLRQFSTSADYQGARQVGAINQAVGQMAQRRGLGDEFSAALTAEQQGQMRQDITQANMDFDSKLSQLLAAEEIGFIKGEFDFMHRLQAMDYAQELSKDMARFQADLASDMTLQGAFGDLLQIGGTALGLNIFGESTQQVAQQPSAGWQGYGYNPYAP